MRNLFTSFAKDESGATAIEYGLIAALLSVAIIAAITSVKGELNTTYSKVGNALKDANATAP
jgi:pilus assembly protein Flp/PilA